FRLRDNQAIVEVRREPDDEVHARIRAGDLDPIPEPLFQHVDQQFLPALIERTHPSDMALEVSFGYELRDRRLEQIWRREVGEHSKSAPGFHPRPRYDDVAEPEGRKQDLAPRAAENHAAVGVEGPQRRR